MADQAPDHAPEPAPPAEPAAEPAEELGEQDQHAEQAEPDQDKTAALVAAGQAKLSAASEALRAKTGVDVEAVLSQSGLSEAAQQALRDEATAAAVQRGRQGLAAFVETNEAFLSAQSQSLASLVRDSGLDAAVAAAGSELLQATAAAASAERAALAADDVAELQGRGQALLSSVREQDQAKEAGEALRRGGASAQSQLPALLQATASKGGEVLETVNLAELAESETTQQLLGKGRELLADAGVDLEDKSANELLSEAAQRLPELTSKAAGVLRQQGEEKGGFGLAAQVSRLVRTTEGAEEKLAAAVGAIDVAKLTEEGQRVATDAEARAAFVARLTNTCLEFFLQYLPHIRVPPISGVKDDVEYTIDNLDMSGFQVAKENIAVELGEFATQGEAVTVRVTNVEATLRGLSWRYRQTYFPYLADQGNADADVSGAAFALAFVVQRVVVDGEDTPRFALGSHGVTISGLRLAIADSRVAWVYNLLVNMFSQICRDYLISTLNDSLADQGGALLKKLNQHAAGYWPLILKYSGLDLAALPETIPEPEEEEEGKDEAGGDCVDAQWAELEGGKRELRVVVRAQGPLGVRLGTSSGATHIRVLGFPRGGAEGDEVGLIESAGLVTLGLVLTHINGESIADYSLPWVIRLLQRAGRPLRLAFAEVAQPTGVSRTYDVEFAPGPLGLIIRRSDSLRAPVVGGFRPIDGRSGPAELSKRIRAGDVLVGIHGQTLIDLPFEQSLDLFRNAPRPISLRFCSPADLGVAFAEYPFDLALAALDGHVVLTGFSPRVGRAQSDGVVQLGHVLHSVNGTNVHALPYKQASLTLRSASGTRPLTLGFVAPEHGTVAGGAGSTGAAEFLEPCEVTFDEEGPLGITFGQTSDSHAYVKAFKMIQGPGAASRQLAPGLVLTAIDGQNLPPGDVELAQQLLRDAAYPCTIGFRDMEQWRKLGVESSD